MQQITDLEDDEEYAAGGDVELMSGATRHHSGAAIDAEYGGSGGLDDSDDPFKGTGAHDVHLAISKKQ